MTDAASPTAAVLIIGNEILSGRTADVNLNMIAQMLTGIGVVLREARVVPDIEGDIVAAVNALRARYTYVFTTGGIGPTHDDITVDAIAAAFGVEAGENPEARAVLAAHYGADKLTPARLRMARTPHGATLINNPISAAPGVKVGNVHILAGVPDIARAMMEGVVATLRHGPALHSKTVSAGVPESIIAEPLGALAARYPQIDIGSYPWAKDGKFGTSLVSRGTDTAAVEAATAEIVAMLRQLGIEPHAVR